MDPKRTPAIRAILAAALVAATASAQALAGPIDDSITRAANRLVGQQSGNGSWVGETGYTGSIVAGLVDAYLAKGTLSYRTSGEAGGGWIVANSSPNFYGDEAYALTRLSSIASDPLNNGWRTAAIDMYVRVSGAQGGGTLGYVNDFSATDPSIAVFYLAEHVGATRYLSVQEQAVWRNGLIRFLGTVDDSATYPVMALGIAVWALAQTGPMDDTLVNPSAALGSLWYHKRLVDLPGMLAAQQVTSGPTAGSFYWRFDHSAPPGEPTSGFTEDTIFGALGLVAANRANSALWYDDEILAARTVLAGGVAGDGKVYETIWSGGALYSAYAGEALQLLAEPRIINEWRLAGSGSYNTASNWKTGIVPDEMNGVANFRGGTTARIVRVNSPVTLGTIIFTSSSRYTVDGPEYITLSTYSGNARIEVDVGEHVISAPLHFGANTEFAIGEDSLTVLGDLDNQDGKTLTKTGDGALIIDARQEHGTGAVLDVLGGEVEMLTDAGNDIAAHLTVNVDSGAIISFVASQHIQSLNVADGGLARITGGPGTVIVLNSLWLGPVPPGGAGAMAVPEPATLGFLAIGCLLALYRRRRP
jgi:hypothetical protein